MSHVHQSDRSAAAVIDPKDDLRAFVRGPVVVEDTRIQLGYEDRVGEFSSGSLRSDAFLAGCSMLISKSRHYTYYCGETVGVCRPRNLQIPVEESRSRSRRAPVL
jgi:hypothetical protein